MLSRCGATLRASVAPTEERRSDSAIPARRRALLGGSSTPYTVKAGTGTPVMASSAGRWRRSNCLQSRLSSLCVGMRSRRRLMCQALRNGWPRRELPSQSGQMLIRHSLAQIQRDERNVRQWLCGGPGIVCTLTLFRDQISQIGVQVSMSNSSDGRGKASVFTSRSWGAGSSFHSFTILTHSKDSLFQWTIHRNSDLWCMTSSTSAR